MQDTKETRLSLAFSFRPLTTTACPSLARSLSYSPVLPILPFHNPLNKLYIPPEKQDFLNTVGRTHMNSQRWWQQAQGLHKADVVDGV